MDGKITVAVPTHGGHERIVRLLNSLCHQTCPRGLFEVLIVDNASTVPIAQVARRHARDLEIRVVHEPELGLAHARNRALREVTTEAVVFLDDDVVASAGLVEAYRLAFEDPSLEAAGGPIKPLILGRRPFWFFGRVLPLFALQDLGAAATYGANYPFGANFAVRISTLRFGFDARLGRRGRSLLSGEEMRFFEQNAFARVAHLPEASVQHVIGEERLRLRWVLRRMLAQLRTRRVLTTLD